MAAVVGVTLAILIIFLVLVIALLIAYKKEKMCFKSEYKILNTYIHLLWNEFLKVGATIIYPIQG